MAVYRTYRVSAYHNGELEHRIATSESERDFAAAMLATRLATRHPQALILAPEVCGVCLRADRVLREDWASAPNAAGVLMTARVCDDCYGYDEESALALADAEGYDVNNLEGELAKFPLDQIDFLEVTLGVGFDTQADAEFASMLELAATIGEAVRTASPQQLDMIRDMVHGGAACLS
jgi:hypothetical protein